MEYLRELFKGKDKKTALNVLAAFVAGVILLITGNTLFTDKTEEKPVPEAQETLRETELAYEEKLEARLEEILSRVDGAGAVKAMVTLSYGREIVIAEDGKYDKSVTEETDAQGGKRTVESLNTTGTKIIMKAGDGSAEPLILKTIEPKVEGVIIVAAGGGDAVVREQLIKAVQTVLGVEPHKVQVLKAKQ